MNEYYYGTRDAGAAPVAGHGPTTTRPPAVIPFERRQRTLSRWPVPRDNENLIVPLGGIGRIGMNWTLYGHAGQWILVDAGIAFPDDNMEDVDAIVPDPTFLRHISDRLLGLVVTHAHEDHIGGIDRLWPGGVNCPIYATPFASTVIARRLEEVSALDDVELNTFEVGESFVIGPFAIRTVRMTHSVPEPVALAITTAAGTILHTGDWKLDPNPLIGLPTDLTALKEIGDAGVTAMVCDSTNANRDLPITSEADVREAFIRLFRARQGTVVVSCFATNVARMASASVAASLSGRKIAFAGRSMRNSEEAANACGLLDGVPQFLAEPRHLQGLDRRETALICTGGQGEERAALARLARGEGWPKLERGDTVVMSSRIIPGNEKAVEEVHSKLRQRGVEIVSSNTLVDGYPVHVSGHPGQTELRTLYGLVRPRFGIPVHGEAEHLAAHAEIATSMGAIVPSLSTEGEVLSVTRDGIRNLGKLQAPLLMMENDIRGNRLPYPRFSPVEAPGLAARP